MSGVTINPENTDRAQLASLGDSANIRPDSATRRNCWTCRYDAIEEATGCHLCRALAGLGVVEWIEQHVAPDSPGVPPSMPPRDAPPCPVWEPVAERATVKESLTVRPGGGWRGHLPLCRGPGGTMARRMAALVRRAR